MNEYYEDIYRILSNNWDEPGLEFFWHRDKSSTVQEVTDSFVKELDMEYYRAFESLGTVLYWTYGNGEDDLEKARQVMTKAYFLAKEKKDKKRISQYLSRIEEDINRKQS